MSMRVFCVRLCLALLAMGSAAGPALAQPAKNADVVIHNAKVWTVDKARPRAEAIAIIGGRIVAVASNAEVLGWAGKQTKRIDARGKTVLPGFIDSHVHLSSGGFELSGVQLKDAKTPEEFVRRIGEQSKKLKKGEWITGGTWDHENWPEAPLPTREWIDRVTPDNPVFVSRYDGHMGLANSLALKLAGITKTTAPPSGGAIVKGAGDEPTGVLKDAAQGLMDRVIPPPTEVQLLDALRAALAHAAQFGVTGIHAISSTHDVRAYQKLTAAGELTARIYAITPIQQWPAPAGAGILAGFGNDWLRIGALKGFADGSLGSTTALFFEPYNDDPGTSGLQMFPYEQGLKMGLGADQAGLQLCIHAIGDAAIRMILDLYAEVEKTNGRRAGRRWRIEHAQHIHPAEFERFSKLGVIASMQPYHAIDDGRWALKRIGTERGKGTYAFRTLLDKGARLAFGSDWTVAPINPLEGIYAAVTRATLDGKNPGGWYPEQKITLEEAIEAYTMGSAFAEFSEESKGSLTVGKLADVVVLDADLWAIPAEKIKDVKVVATLVGGNTVYPKN